MHELDEQGERRRGRKGRSFENISVNSRARSPQIFLCFVIGIVAHRELHRIKNAPNDISVPFCPNNVKLPLVPHIDSGKT